jgi:hypothetical protein
MKTNPLPLPGQKNYEYGYNLAYKLACEQLGKVNIEEQCRKSGARYVVIDSQELAIVEYLAQSYQITLPAIDVSLVDGGAGVPIKDKFLILHYLTLAKGIPITNKFIAFRELPEGANYFPTFSKRSIEPLTEHFGSEPHWLIEAAGKLGGHKVDYGDVAVTINGFSRVPITLVLWRGDEEFPPRSNILFDATIPAYLSTYDITVLCETIVWKLVKFLREGSVKPIGRQR